MKYNSRILYSTVFFIAGALSAPAFALDYEAKPIHWILMSPFRTVGALTGAVVCGAVSGPADKSFHNTAKVTTNLAGKMGDEKGALQILAATPVAVPAGVTVGGFKGIVYGVVHGFKTGWDKPFSRWSYITTEEKEQK